MKRQRYVVHQWKISICEKSQSVDSFYKDLLENVRWNQRVVKNYDVEKGKCENKE
jgi:hypothetical protein